MDSPTPRTEQMSTETKMKRTLMDRLRPRGSGRPRRRGVAVMMSVAMAGAAVASLPVAPASAGIYTTTTSSWGNLSCSEWKSFVVPAGARDVTFTLVGGGGAGGDTVDGAAGGIGGGGGVVSGALPGVAGKTLWAKIGCGGRNGNASAPGYIAGGNARTSRGGGGGAASGLCLGTSTANCGGGTMLAIAAGGGGGGGGSKNLGSTRYKGGNGGHGGSATTDTNRNSGASRAGARGSDGEWGNVNSGIGGNGSSVNFPGDTVTAPLQAPSFGMGGNSVGDTGYDTAGGGGGGGLIGGAGGGAGRYACCNYGSSGGGGGGSSWVTNSSAVATASFAVRTNTNSDCTANSSHDVPNASVAGSGAATGLSGCAGFVTVTYRLDSTGTVFSTQPSATASAGVAFAQQPVVRATNAGSHDGGGVKDESITLSLDPNPSGASLLCNANPVVTGAGGYAPFSGCLVTKPGDGYRLKATNAVTGAVAYSNPFSVDEQNEWTLTDAVNTSAGCGTWTSYALPSTATKATVIAKGGGGGGGGGGGWRDSSKGGDGGAGGTTSLSNFILPRAASGLRPLTFNSLNYVVGCGGALGNSNNGSAAASAGGLGWGAGASSGSSVSSSRSTSGGGGGGGTAACLGANCGAGGAKPVVVAGGGGGGGGNGNYTHAGAGGAAAGGAEADAAWYSSGDAGRGRLGAQGGAGYDGGGGGGAVLSGGAPGGGGTTSGDTGTGSASTGGSGGKGGNGTKTSACSVASGGGGGGGYFNGGGGGGDWHDLVICSNTGSRGSAGGGGGGASWVSRALQGTGSLGAGGSSGGAGGIKNAAGNAGSVGNLKLDLSGNAILMETPANQATTAGTAVVLQVNAVAWAPNKGSNFACCAWSATGLPAGLTIDASTGRITGTPVIATGPVTVTVSAQSTNNGGNLPGNAQFSKSVEFTWQVVPAPPAKWVIENQPSDVIAGVTMTPAVTARSVDAYGNLSPVANNSSVALAASKGSIHAGSTATFNASANRVTFAGIQIRQSNHDVTLSVSGAGISASDPSTPFDVIADQPHRLAFVSQPADPSQVASSLGNIEVNVLDQFDNIVDWLSDTPDTPNDIVFAIRTGTGNPDATLSGTMSRAVEHGVVEVSDLEIDLTGFGYVLTATWTGDGELATESGAFDVMVFAPVNSIVPLTTDMADPSINNQPGLYPGSGVSRVSYYYCAGKSGACASWTLIQTVTLTDASDPSAPVNWTSPSTPGMYRVVTVGEDRVGNVSSRSAATPIRVG